MNQNTSQIREKDVINVCSGRKIGFICDFVIDTDCGKITDIIVSDHYFTLTGGKNTFCIPWEKISCIGEDAILVKLDDQCLSDCKRNYRRDHDDVKRKKGGWFI